jgi:hypothetical protein
VIDGTQKIEVVDLVRNEWMELIAEGATAKEIRAAALELACARATEHEGQSPITR